MGAPDPNVYQLGATIKRHELGVNMLQLITADTTGIASNKGFIPAVTGNVKIRGRADAAGVYVVVPVQAGGTYPIDVESVDITNSTASQKIVILRQGGS